MSKWIIAAIALFAAAGAKAQTSTEWTNYPGFFLPGYNGIVLADIDGDGRNEAIVSGSSGGGFSPSGTSFLAVLRYDGGTPSTFRVSYLRHLGAGESLSGQVIKLRPAGASQDEIYVAVTSSAGTRLARFGGARLDPLSSVSLTSAFRLAGVADVDADGQLEAYGHTCTSMPTSCTATVLDAASGAVEWLDSVTSSGIAAGQFDADPALELVINGTPGRVLDGASHAVDWSYPSGFADPGKVVVGNFLGTPTYSEFAVLPASGPVRVFSTSPSYGLAREYSTNHPAAVGVADVNGDQVDEVLFGDDQYANMCALSATTGTCVYFRTAPEYSIGALAIGDLDGKPGPELIYSADLNTTSRDVLKVVSMGTGADLYSAYDEAGPHSSVALADLDQDGRLEAIYATYTSASNSRGPDLVIADAATGIELRRVAGVLWSPHYNPGLSIRVANLDGDPQLEIIVGLADVYSAAVVVLDGVDLSTQWRSVSFGFGVVSDLELMPTPGGIPNIVAALGNNDVLHTGVQAVLLDGSSGAMLWKSASFPQVSDPRLAVGNFDGDANLEVALADGASIAILDATTGQTDRTQLAGGIVIGQRVESVGGVCYLVQITRYEIERTRCTESQIASTRLLPVAASYVGFLGDSFGPLVLSDGQRALLDSAGTIIAQSEVLDETGGKLGWGDRGAFTSMPGGIGVLLGGGDSVSLVKLVETPPFADSFE